MRLLYDRLRRQIVKEQPERAHYFEGVEVFYNEDAMQRAIDNEVELDDLPSLVPPYERFFVEAKIPITEDVPEEFRSGTPFLGTMVQVFEWSDAPNYPNPILPEGVERRWSCLVDFYIDNVPTNRVVTVARGIYLLDGEGHLIDFRFQPEDRLSHVWFQWSSEFYGLIEQRSGEVGAEQAHDEARTVPAILMDTTLFTIGMLNCRNIGTEVVQPRQAEAKKFQKHYGVPMTRYHILKVTGKGRDAGVTIGALHSVGSVKRPLHWARGHVRHYKEEAPLFGHYVGSVYVHPHTRGTPVRGVVDKDYDVDVDVGLVVEKGSGSDH